MRAANMQVLTDDVKRKHPGVVIYGIGDPDHAEGVSGHNEDDTPGVRAELQDADTKREHRAIDIMVGPNFSKADGDALVAYLLADPKIRARMYYIIWYGYEWSRSSGWKKVRYNGKDKHTNHVHISGWADDDENTAHWISGNTGGVEDLFCYLNETSEAVGALQVRLKNLSIDGKMPDLDPGTIDKEFGKGTQKALRAAILRVRPKSGAMGDAYNKDTLFYVDVLMAKVYGGGGQKGDKGDKGDKGEKGDPGTLPATLRLIGSVRVEDGTGVSG